jgi:gamma-resorcylate decarboxylase
MDGKVAVEEHFSTELNSKYWDAKGEDGRNGRDYARDPAALPNRAGAGFGS